MMAANLKRGFGAIPKIEKNARQPVILIIFQVRSVIIFTVLFYAFFSDKVACLE